MKAITSFLVLLVVCNYLSAQTINVTVYFPFNSSELPLTEQSKLDSALHKISGTISRVEVIAHCDQVGSFSYNDSLSMARANTVKTFLVNRNIPDSVQTTLAGKGERVLVTENWDEESRQLNRRAEVSITYSIPTVVAKQVPNKLVETITDTSFKTGQTIVLRNINFYGGRHVILPSSKSALLELLDAMQRLPDLQIEIQGHICCATEAAEHFDGFDGWDIDTRQYRLSNNRARSIYNFLRDNGIPQQRMSWKGFGYKHPLITPEISEADRTTNRRVEIKILAK